MSEINPSQQLRRLVAENNSISLQEFLQKITRIKKFSAKNLIALHDALLFSMAYSPDKNCYEASEKVLEYCIGQIRSFQPEYQDSGMQNTCVVSCFSLELLQWFHKNNPNCVRFHSFDEPKKDIGEDLKLLFPDAEAEVFTWGWSKTKLVRYLCGGKITIEKLLHVFGSSSNARWASQLFQKIGVFVTVDLKNNLKSRTTARSINYPPFHHQQIQKKFSIEEILNSPLPKSRRLSEKEKLELNSSAKMMLAALGRETDPVTNCSIPETEFFVLQRGFAIAFFYLKPDYRLAFDGYVGYLMYKNGLPIAYGGAWIFFDRALIGINIFDAFRGGESGFLFAQLLRAYSQRFKVNAFSVEPYQYGKNNPEGIKSGAYWFYFRFGFRSDDSLLKNLAEEEVKKISQNKNYKSPPSTLRQFTKSNITLEIKPGKHLNASELSMRITDTIAKEFSGNRIAALKEGEKRLKQIFGTDIGKTGVKTVFQNWFLAALVLNIKPEASKKEKKDFAKLLQDKSFGKEADYLTSLSLLKSLFCT
jgi:hypothetical protein